MPPAPVPLRVLLFDGECGLCQRVAGILLRIDRRRRLHFAPLQSAAAQKFLRDHGLPTDDFDSLIYVPDWNAPGQPYLTRTDGGLRAFGDVGGMGKLVALLRIIPRGMRDAGYRVVAKWRFKVFGHASLRALENSPWTGRLLV